MRFQITIKQQAQAINGKAKFPLYKPRGQKNFDQQYGIQTLDELIENSSIKIFCNQCEKEITQQTIIIGYEDVEIVKDTHQNFNENNQEKKIKEYQQIETKNMLTNMAKSKTQISKVHDRKNQELFEQNQSESNQQDPNQQLRNQLLQQIEQAKMEEQQKQQQPKQTEKQSHQPTFLYCVGCFASLQELPKFYSIRKSLKMAPANSKWRVIDEICLLNGLKFWGFGNWSQIKQFMDYNACPFTIKQIESHYQQIYLKGDCPFSQKLSKNKQKLEYSNLVKPPKRLVSKMMHDYYYPPQSLSKLGSNSRESLESNMKRQRPLEFDQKQEQKIDLVKTSSMKGLPSKQPHGAKTLFNNNFANLASHTSLKNVLQKTQHFNQTDNHDLSQKMKYENQDGKSEDEEDSSQSEQEQLFQEENQPQNEIQLKPKLSNILQGPSSNNMLGSKFVNQQHGQIKSDSLKPQSLQKVDQKMKQTQTVHPKYSNLKGHNVYSYNPKRKEFQIIEYDYYAESMIAQLQFSQEDTEEQQMLKIKIIEEYNRRLDERIKRRQFVIEHRLLDTDFTIKTFQKYNKNNIRKFQPFRRLIDKNQQYFDIVQTYDTLCKTKALTEGLIKVKRKLKKTIKHPNFRDILDYLNVKKQKKQLLGQRAKLDRQKERKILTRQSESNKGNKRIALSMAENSLSYLNTKRTPQKARIQISPISPQIGSNNRRMSSRSEERQRLRTQNQNFNGGNMNLNEKYEPIESSKVNFEEINLNSKQMKMNSQAFYNSSNLLSLLSQEDMKMIEKMMSNKQLRQNGSDVAVEMSLVTKNNFIAKPLTQSFRQNK